MEFRHCPTFVHSLNRSLVSPGKDFLFATHPGKKPRSLLNLSAGIEEFISGEMLPKRICGIFNCKLRFGFDGVYCKMRDIWDDIVYIMERVRHGYGSEVFRKPHSYKKKKRIVCSTLQGKVMSVFE
ncbi:hypothetical protein CEXT_599441 [Caerostris extrusa]|uniref:Uncharacterized protein n=1 Tax=Caerostris extrusa TaxID=172846 RepID=A0AAV4P7W1_CAEEX|nr:hypothetical protein CEXT_599441 [Caerostris extrusa]